MRRQITLDTETTGLDPKEGHRIIELACVELLDRRVSGNNLHLYFNPGREVDLGAEQVHGITREMLKDKPRFSECIDEFLAFIDGAEVIIHNAPFDVGFINHEFRIARRELGGLERYCQVTDTLVMARALYPGQRNSLDALCKRVGVDNSHRQLHGALLDAELLASVYLGMTGGQKALAIEAEAVIPKNQQLHTSVETGTLDESISSKLKVVLATDEENKAHEARLAAIAKSAKKASLWSQLTNEQE